jgi:hypothetical protein
VVNWKNYVESNLPNLNHYEIFKNLEGFYFITENEIIYSVYFISGEEYLPNQSYSNDLYVFGFQANSKYKGFADKKVETSILKILTAFFENNRNLIVYSCDQSDKKELARKRLFDKWFNAYGLINFIKVDFEFESNLYVSIIYRKDNPQISDIEQTLSYFGNTLYNK